MYLAPDVDANLTQRYSDACPHANLIKFPFENFPASIQILQHYRFKPMYSAMALRNHKILLSFDTSVIFQKDLNFTVSLFHFPDTKYIDGLGADIIQRWKQSHGCHIAFQFRPQHVRNNASQNVRMFPGHRRGKSKGLPIFRF